MNNLDAEDKEILANLDRERRKMTTFDAVIVLIVVIIAQFWTLLLQNGTIIAQNEQIITLLEKGK